MIHPLEHAIQLRESGKAEEALTLLRDMQTERPADPRLNYQCAWTLDSLGRETEAIPYYERAIEGGLEGDDLRGAMLGLGSTYRCVGQYGKSAAMLRRGMRAFPDAREFRVFLALAQYNLGDHQAAMEGLITTLLETTQDADLLQYRNALAFYADKLDQIWQ